MSGNPILFPVLRCHISRDSPRYETVDIVTQERDKHENGETYNGVSGQLPCRSPDDPTTPELSLIKNTDAKTAHE